MKLKKKIRKTIIIAEAGVNHNGNLHNSIKLIDIASKAVAVYVKFQTFDVEYLILKKTKTASYQKKNLNKKISQYNMLKKYQLTKQNHLDLIKHAKKKKLSF